VASMAAAALDPGRKLARRVRWPISGRGEGPRRLTEATHSDFAGELRLLAELATTGIPVVASAGSAGGTFVAKELVYAYAMWISPGFWGSTDRSPTLVVASPGR